MLARVTESKAETIDRLHRELADLYRDGGYEVQRINVLWGRIERLEAEQVRARVRSEEGIEHE